MDNKAREAAEMARLIQLYNTFDREGKGTLVSFAEGLYMGAKLRDGLPLPIVHSPEGSDVDEGTLPTVL